MICTNCGSQCNDDQVFCPSCGMKLNHLSNSQVTNGAQMRASQYTQPEAGQSQQGQYTQPGAGQNQFNGQNTQPGAGQNQFNSQNTQPGAGQNQFNGQYTQPGVGQNQFNNQYTQPGAGQNQFNNQYSQPDFNKNQFNSAPNFGNQGNQNYMGQMNNGYNNGITMVWYKVLIYGLLFLSAFANVIYGIIDIVGSDMSHLIGGGYRVMEVIYGLGVIAIAVASVYVRQLLAGYKKEAPKMLLALYIVSGCWSILYTIIISIILSSYTRYLYYYGHASVVGQCVGMIIGIIIGVGIMTTVNYIYFKKREFMFNN